MTLLRAAARLGQPDASRVQNSSVDGDVSSSSLPPNHPPLQRADAVVTGGESCRARTAGGRRIFRLRSCCYATLLLFPHLLYFD